MYSTCIWGNKVFVFVFARQFHGPCMKPVGLWSTLARAQSPGESLYVITGRVPPGNPLDGRGSRGIMAPTRAPYPPSIKLGVCCSGWVYFQIACCWWFFNIFLCIRVLYVPGLNYSFNTWLQRVGQRRLQDQMRIISILEFGASYIRDFTIMPNDMGTIDWW